MKKLSLFTIVLAAAFLQSCAPVALSSRDNGIRCRNDADCSALTKHMIVQFEKGAIEYFGDDTGFKHISHYSITDRTQDMIDYCGPDLTCFSGESIVVSDTLNEYEMCFGIMTAYGQAYSFEYNGVYDQNYDAFLDYYQNYIPNYCQSL